MLTYSNFTYADPSAPFYQRTVIRSIEAITGKARLWKLYARYHKRSDRNAGQFWADALELLNITLEFDEHKLAPIPREGNPLVIVANHPYGVIDGLAIGHIAQLLRRDFRVLTNSVLCKAEEVRHYVLPVDFAPTKDAWNTNLDSRQKARALLKLGGCLVIFPAGGVSSKHNLRDAQAWNPAWQSFAAALIQGNKADVLPLFFHGQNSQLFQWASLTSQTLRLSLFFSEVVKRMGTTLRVEIGEIIPHTALSTIQSREDVCTFLWQKTYALGGYSEFPTPKPAFRIEGFRDKSPLQRYIKLTNRDI